MRNIFESMLKTNLSAAKMISLKIVGDAAMDAAFSDPTLMKRLTVTEAMTLAASVTDDTTLHGKLMRELAFGMNMSTVDKVLEIMDQAGVFQVKDEDLKEEMVREFWKKTGFISTDPNSTVKFNKAAKTSATTVLPKNAIKKNNVSAKTEVVIPLPTAEDIAAKEEVSKVEAAAVAKSTTIRADEVVCPVCKRNTKVKKMRVFKPPFPAMATEEMKLYIDAQICAQCNSTFVDQNKRDEKAHRAQVEADRKIEEKTNKIAELTAQKNELQERADRMAKTANATKDPDVKKVLEADVIKTKNNVAAINNNITSLTNDINKIKKYGR